jgi:glutamyl-tRNA reductase
MESLGLIGISVRDHDAATLARFTIPKEERQLRVAELAAELGVEELLYLATCNRVEIAFRLPAGSAGFDLRRQFYGALHGLQPEPGVAERTLRGWVGEGAVEHLFLVAAGLDSAQLGEREIQGQLREALDVARAAATSGVVLDRLIEEALRVAHQVHLRTQLGSGRMSLAEIAADALVDRLRRTPSPVALIGVSPMTRRCAEALLREHQTLLLVNRTLEHATRMAADLGAGTCMTLAEFRQRPPQIEALLTATAAPEAILDRSVLERLAARTASGEPPLIVDLAVPPDVEPEVACAAHVPRLGMDAINAAARSQRESRLAETAAAREMVDAALQDWRRRLTERALAPVIARMNQRYRQTAIEGVERLLGKPGGLLAGQERESIERWAETLARRFAHLPTLGLRGLAQEQGMLAVRSFLAACDASLFAEFCQVAGQLEWLQDRPAEAVEVAPSAAVARLVEEAKR